jgi:hypothetical protein
VEQPFTVDIDAEPARLFSIVSDLASYADWLDIVDRVEPERPAGATDPGAGPEAWTVTLRATLGPLARSKRLRMIRAVSEAPHRVRFERQERDGRQHAPWTLESTVEPVGGGSALTMSLAYGGRLWSPMLRAVLEAQVDSATANLQALAAT